MASGTSSTTTSYLEDSISDKRPSPAHPHSEETVSHVPGCSILPAPALTGACRAHMRSITFHVEIRVVLALAGDVFPIVIVIHRVAPSPLVSPPSLAPRAYEEGNGGLAWVFVVSRRRDKAKRRFPRRVVRLASTRINGHLPLTAQQSSYGTEILIHPSRASALSRESPPRASVCRTPVVLNRSTQQSGRTLLMVSSNSRFVEGGY
jgi:hypothetical protein